MIRTGLIVLLAFCFTSARLPFYKGSSDLFFKNTPDNPFTHLVTKFQKSGLPYETGKIKAVKLSDGDSSFLKSALQSKSLVAVTDQNAAIWDDADDEGKIHFDFPDLIGVGAIINMDNDILLLEIVDMYELKGESESNKQGVFVRTTFLCTFTKAGKFINAAVSNFTLANEHGSLNRWSCTVNSANEIIIKEYGSRIEQKDTYGFTTTLKVMSDGKIVKVKSVKG